MNAICWFPVKTAPEVGSSSPATSDNNVLLPQPDAPTKQTNSPFRTLIDTSASALTAELPPPYVFDTAESRTAASAVAFEPETLVGSGVFVGLVMR
jgi:hypothetical protein